MSTPNGYNNPAYCHQFDSSLYDYQYVPEIDPDSPDLELESNRRGNHTKLVHPKFKNVQGDFSESDSFEGSDESNRSIIIEECNNRRVTLICEKRSKAEVNEDEFYEDRNCRGAYYQDISLESENGYDRSRKKHEERSARHQRPLEPPVNQVRGGSDRRIGSIPSFKQSTTSINSYHRPQRLHRYEEIPSDQDYMSDMSTSPSVHRYAEIMPDENGYPTITKEIKVEETYPTDRKIIPKPRAISPVSQPKPFSPPPTPSRVYQRSTQISPNFSSPFIYCSSPVERNSFEMSELSPPRETDSTYQGNDQTFFIYSPKRQPPIGASAANEPQEFNSFNGRCILPKNLQQFTAKSSKDRSQSLPNSPAKTKQSHVVSSPHKPQSDKKLKQIFHIKPVKPSPLKQTPGKVLNDKENYSVRRNISNSFTDPPREKEMLSRSPYKPTTEVIPQKTAIITPIFQRKNQQVHDDFDFNFSPRRNFEKMSQAFQSTGNLFRSTRDQVYPSVIEPRVQEKSTKIKRNQSVPNFSQLSAAENRMFARKNQEIIYKENQKYPKSLEFQYSPKKQVEQLSPINKSRISLIDQTRSTWTISDSDAQPSCSICFIFATVVHLVTATATCAITFYLLSKVGRRYYLDFGLIAGFINFILGLLGFRSYCWRWIPNRNYVSGFIGLAAFSALTCAGLTYIITARPMAGDPILDIMGGAICAVSVLTIVLALTGLTMSGCCKAPPPDNRVTDI